MSLARLDPIRLAVALLLLPTMAGLPVRAAASNPRSECPDVTGRYSVVGTGSAMSDALDALQASAAGFLDSGVELAGALDGRLQVRTKGGSGGNWSARATILQKGTDFDCAGGRLNFIKPVFGATRKTEEGTWFEGQATMALSRLANGELSISVRFTGSQRITLYQYDSANISIPKPGTRAELRDLYRWPPYTETNSLPLPSPPEPFAMSDVRGLLTASVLGNVTLVGLRPSGGSILATLKSQRSKDVASFEDRLRAASIPYETKVAPIWSNNSYHVELLFRPSGYSNGRRPQPSAFRIEQELERTLPALVETEAVAATDSGYLVTLRMGSSQQVADVIRLVQANSTLIGSMVFIDESSQPASRIRIVRLRIQLR